VRIETAAGKSYDAAVNGDDFPTTPTEAPVGPPVDAAPARWPDPLVIHGRLVTLAPLDPATHGAELWESVRGRDDLWTYLFEGPFHGRGDFERHLGSLATSADRVFHSILDNANGEAVGYASYLRIEPAHRVIEVGNILYTPRLQRTAGATEAMYLMARHAFETLGYRRYEWKCNALNAPSRRAALRLGFTFEGVFRQHMIIKGRSRDTAWYAMLDGEWPERKSRLERWLDPANFDEQGRQRVALSAMP
jgi:RimJ/RimL family protein N-acetyltransferase